MNRFHAYHRTTSKRLTIGRTVRPGAGVIVALLVALYLSGCGPAASLEGAETGSDAPDAQPSFTILAEVGADTSFTYAVDVSDSLAVFGRGRDVVVVDVADPSRPRILGSVALEGPVRDVVLRGKHAFAAADSSGLYIIDLSNPAAPSAVGRIRFADRAYGIDAANGRAYVAARSAGLRILNVSNPADPVELGHFDTPDEAVDVHVRGNFAYVAAWYESMRVVDVSDPAAPEEVSHASYDSYDNGAAWSVHVDGDMAVQAVPDMGLRTVDVTDPHDVKLYKVYRGLFAPVGASVRGRTAYVADQDAGFRVLDLADPVMPVEIGSLDLPGRAVAVSLSGSVAYVAAREGGLRIVDISRPYDPHEIAHLDAADEIVDLARIGDTLIAAGRQNGVALYPSAASLEGAAFISGPSTRLAVHGGTLLVGGSNRISLYDRSDLISPVADALLSGPAHGIAADDEIVIVAAKRSGLLLLARSSLREVGTFEPDRALVASSDRMQLLRTPVAAWDVLLEGERAIAAFDDGIRLIDVSTPSRPMAITFHPTPQRVYRLLLVGSRLFAACDDGLRVIDISDPSQPTEETYLKTPSFGTALVRHGDRIYIGDLSGVVTTVQLSEPHARIAEVKVADRILSLATLENGLAVAAGSQGIRAIADIPARTSTE